MLSKPKPFRSENYLKFIRTFPCIICYYPHTVAHHESLNNSGTATKPPDTQTLPLCIQCHNKRHATGKQTFWADKDYKSEILNHLRMYISWKYNVNPEKYVIELITDALQH
jgi:hypothetical protein